MIDDITGMKPIFLFNRGLLIFYPPVPCGGLISDIRPLSFSDSTKLLMIFSKKPHLIPLNNRISSSGSRNLRTLNLEPISMVKITGIYTSSATPSPYDEI